MTLRWRTPSGTVNSTREQEVSLLIQSSALTISNITASDGGTYTCIAENVAGASEATATLYICPYITEQPGDILTTNGSTESITCLAESFPDPRFHWEKLVEPAYDTSGSGLGETLNSCSASTAAGSGEDFATYSGDNTPLRPRVGYDIVSVGQTLNFNPVLFGDEGMYYCVVSTLFGESLADGVTVFSELSEAGLLVL